MNKLIVLKHDAVFATMMVAQLFAAAAVTAAVTAAGHRTESKYWSFSEHSDCCFFDVQSPEGEAARKSDQ